MLDVTTIRDNRDIIINDSNDSNNDNIRTNDNRNDSLSNSDKIKNINDKNINNNVNNRINIYRYKFTDEFTSELFKFSKVHQYDHRKDFKEAWETWMEDNDEIVNDEVRRLTNLGYDGDILDKMFKSARYYFRKKSTEKKAPSERRDYVGTQKDMLDAMDNHIKSKINDQNYKPSDGFDEFCKSNLDLLKEEIANLCKSGFTDSNEIKQKIKKTYKNRYFLIISK
jgi:hypothetical protein